MPKHTPTNLIAALHYRAPGRSATTQRAPYHAAELIVDRSKPPGIYLPSSSNLSFTPSSIGEKRKWDWERAKRRIEVVADLGQVAGEMEFEVEFGYADGNKEWSLAAHLYLIPPYDPGLPLATRTPTWLGGTTLPALTEHLTAKISAHYVGPDKRRRLAFAKRDDPEEERTLLLTVHRIVYVGKTEHETSSPERPKKKKVKVEAFSPAPEHLLIATKGVGKGAKPVGDGLLLKASERVERFDAYAIKYVDHQESPFIEFVFHCRSSQWIKDHSAVEIPRALSLLNSPLSQSVYARDRLNLSPNGFTSTPRVSTSSIVTLRSPTKPQRI